MPHVCAVSAQVFPGLILSDIKPAKRLRFRTVCYLLVQLMHCRKMFKAEIPFSNVMTCEDDDKVGSCRAGRPSLPAEPASHPVRSAAWRSTCLWIRAEIPLIHACMAAMWSQGHQPTPPSVGSIPGCPLLGLLFGVPRPGLG